MQKVMEYYVHNKNLKLEHSVLFFVVINPQSSATCFLALSPNYHNSPFSVFDSWKMWYLFIHS